MSDVSQWSTTAASNNAAPPNGWPEAQAPSTVNDCAREMMAALARWYSDIDGTLTSGGTGNAYTLTTNSTHAALADMPVTAFRVDRANTGAATLNVDGLGAKNLQHEGAALASGDLTADQVIIVAYNATNDVYDILGGVLPSHTHAAGDIASGTFDDARVAESNVTQHEAALAINTDQLTTDFVTDGSTSHTVGDGDAESIRRFTSSSAITVTLPNSTPTGWAVGDSMVVIRGGSGSLTFSSTGTIRSPGGSTINLQHGKAAVTLVAAGVWELSGNV